MSGFPDWPNPMRSGAMQCAVGATSGMIFRHRYDEVGFPCRKKRDRCVRVSRFPVGHGGTQNTHLGQYNIIREFHFLLSFCSSLNYPSPTAYSLSTGTSLNTGKNDGLYRISLFDALADIHRDQIIFGES